MSFKLFELLKKRNKSALLNTNKDSASELPKDLTQEEKIAVAMKCDIYNLTSVDELAVATVLIPSKIQNKDSVLCDSDITRCDTILFSAFVIRAILIGSAQNHEKAYLFSKEYLEKIIRGTKYLYNSTSDFFNDMFDNRMGFYDTVFMSKDNIDAMLKAVVQEFEYIIAFDIINEEYCPFYQDSPLPLIGFDEMIKYKLQIGNFVSSISDLTAPHYQRVIDFLQK